jgi:hypothetical protein
VPGSPRGLSLVLEAAVKDRDKGIVFPSSVAADFWARETIIRGWARALDGERFLGWDRFRELAFSAPDDGRTEAGKEIRSLFAADLLAENSVRPFLRNIVPRERAGEWTPFAPGLGRALPYLKRLAGKPGSAKDARAADYLEVLRRYEAFLERRSLRESAWGERDFNPRGRTWLIVYPELIEDFTEYGPALSGAPGVAVEAIAAEAAIPSVRVEASVLDEISRVMASVEEFLDCGGGRPDDVVITCAGLDAMKPYLAREAKLRGLPLDVRSGAPLSSHPAGRIFSRFKELADSLFSYESMRDVLLDSALAWKEGCSARELLRFGAEMTVARGWREGAREFDAWESAFKDGGDKADSPMKAFYRGLRTNVLAITGAKGFKEIKAAWSAFSRSMLRPSGRRPDADMVIGRCVAVLDALEDAREAGGFAAVRGAYGLFASSLSAERYVGASAPGGVRVYDYRVSAGMEAKRHFVLNASEALITVRGGVLGFLREDLREGMDLGGRDMSLDFIRAYGLSGEQVFFSSSLEGLDGPQMPHGAFTERLGPGNTGDDAGLRGPVAALEARYAHKAPFPERASPSVRKGLEAAAVCAFHPPAVDWTEEKGRHKGIEAAGRAALMKLRGGEEEGLLVLSPTMLTAYRACALSWLWDKVLGAGKEAEGIAALDQRFIGNAYHKALENLYAVGEAAGSLRGGEAARRIERAVGIAAGEMARRKGPLARTIIDMSSSDFAIVLGGVLSKDAEIMPGAVVAALEAEAGVSFPDEGFAIRGRIDRLMRTEEGLVILDYKSRSTLRKADFEPLIEDGAIIDLADVQFPAYALILSEGGMADSGGDGAAEERKIRGALAFSIGARKYIIVAADDGDLGTDGRKKSVMDRAGLMGAASALKGIASGIAEEIREFRFPMPDREAMETVCGSCVARNVCRARYNVR